MKRVLLVTVLMVSVLLVMVLGGCAGQNWVPQAHHPPSLPLEVVQPPPPPPDQIETLRHSTAGAKAIGETIGATTIYEKSLGSVYPITTRPHHTTTVIFPAGEELTGDVTGGKEMVKYQPFVEAEPQAILAWLLAKGASGQGPTHRFSLDITPQVPNVQTTVVVRTTGGWYVLEVRSTPKTYQPIVAVYAPPPPAPVTPQPVVRLNGPMGIGYDILVPDDQAVPWAPESVFDTQALTVFQFPSTVPQGQVPELYQVNAAGKRLLANRTPYGQTLLLGHGVFPAWELKLGDIVVRVRQRRDYAVVSCPEAVGCPAKAAIGPVARQP